ncbi:MAG TPA: site-specific integrase [Bauldia sp.]
MLNFTDLAIRHLPPGYHFDKKMPSFGIRIGTHRNSWVVIKGPNRTKVTIGHYPQLSLSDARNKARIALGSPLDRRSAPTFPEALETFLAQPRWRPRSRKVLESSLRHFGWKRPIDKITHEDVAQALDAVGTVSARNHALKDIRTFFNWCVPRYLPSSPCQGLKLQPTASRARVLTDEELKRVWIASEEMGYPFGTIAQLLILTGQRKSEIGGLEWKYLGEDRITLPPTVTKNGREHTFPVAPLAAARLEALSRTTNHSHLFLTHRGASLRGAEGIYNGYAFHLKQLHKASATSDWTLHDLRRTFATGLASLGVPIHVTEKLLNHVSGTTGGIVAVYQRHSYWTEQVAALKAWEDKVLSLARSG